MKRIKATILNLLAAFTLSCLLSGEAVCAQSPSQPDENQTIQSLLDEVRLLRKTLQRTGLNAYRSQIIVERLRAVNEQVLRLTRVHEEVRGEVENIDSSIPRMSEPLKHFEIQITQEPDPNRRQMLEFELKDRKLNLEMYKQRLERLREREMQLSTQLRAEQAKQGELESRLEALEREIESEIERQKSEDASRENRKQKL